jgi:ABC-2 type transport system permease protein
MPKLHRIAAFIIRHWFELKSSIDRKADVFFFPVIDILVFGFLSTYINRLNGSIGLAATILGGIIFWTLLYNIQRDVPFALLDEAWSRNIFNFYASPIKLSEIVIGILLLSIVKALISTVIIILLAAGMFKFSLLGMGPVLAFYVLNIFVFGWSFGFFTSGIILHFGTKAQAVSWSLILLIYPFTGALYPISVLPAWMAYVAKIFPASYIFEGARNFFLYGSHISNRSIAAIVVLNLFYLVFSLVYYSRGHKQAKRRGWYVNPT